MRIATGTIFDAGVTSIGLQTAQVLKLQQQISANRRILVPSDDPIASARALEVTQSDSINAQHGLNAKTAGGRLELTESILGQSIGLLQSAREATIQGGDGALTEADRKSVAASIRALREELISLANSSDGEGNFLFSGFQTDVKPFTSTPAGIQYNGDDGERLLQISTGRQMAVSASGADAYMRMRQGNGTFVVGTDPLNTGTLTYSPGTVTDATALTGNDYRIEFTVTPSPAGDVITYDVLDVTGGTTIATAQPYTSGQAITFDGMQVVLEGVPVDADAVTIVPSERQSVFQTLADLADALESPALLAHDRSNLTNSLTDALINIDQGIDSLTSLQSVFGTRMRETDNTQDASELQGIQYKATLSQLQDLDYAKAVSDMIRAQTNLQAAQQTFVQTSRLSIFDYI